MYKLVVLDLDDTIVNANNNNSISKEVLHTIKKVQEKGVDVILASGRAYQSMKRTADFLDISLPIISYNGALIKNEEKTIYKELVDENVAQDVIEYFFSKGRILQLYTFEGLFSMEKCMKTWLLEEAEGVKCQLLDEITYKNTYSGLLKMLIRLKQQEINSYRQELEERFSEKATSAVSHKVYLEITNKDVSKGKALKIICDYLSIKREEVIVIGDSPNDKSMIEWAGLGVAMGNASDEIKKIADAVTLSVDDDGVAYALKQYVL